MLYVRQLQEMFDIDEDLAFMVYQRMDLDFSECTLEEFDDAAMVAWNAIMDRHFINPEGVNYHGN